MQDTYLRKQTDKTLDEITQRVTKEYAQAEKEVREKMDTHFRKFNAKDKKKQAQVKAGEISQKEYMDWRAGQMATGERWSEMREQLAKDLTNHRAIADSITNGYRPEVYALGHNYGTYEVEQLAQIDTSYTLYNRESVERLIREDPELLKPPGKRMREKIRAGKAIQWERGQIQSVTLQSILQGESVPNMAKRIAKTLCVKDRSAALRYARTAINGAENAGRYDSYMRAKRMGLKLKKVWSASLDDRTRDAHAQIDGVSEELEKPFVNEYGEIMYPGDPGADARNVWNCRCTMITEFEGFERDLSDLSKRNTSYLHGMTYDEWKNSRKGT